MTDEERQEHQWTSVEAAEFTAFLKTATGIKFLRALALEEPQLLRKGDTNEILIRSGEVAQHKLITSFLLALTGEALELQDENTSEPNAYPSLTDDSKWDGPPLKEPQ
jgi:hypothetical protein